MSTTLGQDRGDSELYSANVTHWNQYEEEMFPALRLARVARVVRKIGRLVLAFLILVTLAMLFAPWQQSIRGEGTVIALDPFERPQPVQAPVKGRIKDRGPGVAENAYVTEGQLLFMIEDQDPLYLTRLQQQVGFAETELQQAKDRLTRAEELRDLNRGIVTFAEGELEAMQTARRELVAAYGEFVQQAENKLAAEENKLIGAKAKLWQADLDNKRKRQLFEEGIESELKAQEAEQKFRDATANVGFAEQEVLNAQNGVEGKKLEQAAYNQEWLAKINKVDSQLEKAKGEVAKAEIAINKTLEEINQKETKLLDKRSDLSVQQTQKVLAPRDGYIMNLTVFESGSIVKPGDELCRIVPRTEHPAVQVWVSGNDAPLIAPGRHVRLQFEGWPAVQFSGWPSVAVGTFGGEVALVDPMDNGRGKFRVVVVPDPETQDWPKHPSDPLTQDWPKHPFIRQGGRANAWVLLDQVSLGYEIWRRMNGFPQSLRSQEEKLAKPPKVKI